jgi:hypothetical protein
LKNVIMGIIAAGALGLALWLMLGQGPANNEDEAEGMGQMQYWVCNSCKADLSMTKQQFVDAASAGNFRCAQCSGTDMLLAVPCPLCGRAVATIGHGRLPTTCPHCNGSLGDHRDVSGTPGLENEAAGQPSAPPPPG